MMSCQASFAFASLTSVSPKCCFCSQESTSWASPVNQFMITCSGRQKTIYHVSDVVVVKARGGTG